ncbi:MAG: DNA internalization-related competence protein ComEC/Rec2 [Archangium sp.]
MNRWTWWSLGNRPAVFPVLAVLLGVVFGPLLEVAPPGWFSISAVSLLLVLALRGRRGSVLLGLIGAWAIGAGLAELQLNAAMPPLQQRVVIEGVVERVAPHGVMLDVAAVDGVPMRFRASLTRAGAGVELLPGQRVLVEAKFRPLSDVANPGETSRIDQAWRRGQTVTGTFVGARVVKLSAPSAFQRWLTSEHSALERDTHRLTDRDDASALLLTLSAGRRSELDDDVEDAFARSGLAHVLSVSGLHVAVLAFAVFGALRWLLSRRQRALFRVVDPRAFAAPLSIPIVWLYVVFTGWQGPAVRSAVMCSLMLVAWALRRRSDPLNGIALAALAMVVIDPAAPFDLSVQLSFCAVVALVLLAPVLRAAVPLAVPSPAVSSGWRLRLARWREAVVQTVCASVAVTMASAPLVLMAFQRVSFAGLISNVVALPLSGALTLVAAGGAAVHAVWSSASTPLLWLGVQLSRVFVWLAESFAALPGGTASLPAARVELMMAWWLGLALLVLARGKWRWGVLLAPAALALHLLVPVAPQDTRVTFLSVGHGDAIVVSSRGHHALIDGGGVPEGSDTGVRFVVPFLRQARIERLDLAVLSHAHPDHALGLISTLENVPIDRLWLPAEVGAGPLVHDLMEAAGDAIIEEKEAGEPGLQLGDVTIEVLGPPHDQTLLEGENDRSVVLLLRHGDVSFLLTGDIEEEGERALSARLSAVTVMKAPHHGSETSSTEDFVAATRPRHVVFCVGRRNRFHFPREPVVERWKAVGAECHRTDLDGAITFISDGRDVRVEKFGPVHERQARGAK